MPNPPRIVVESSEKTHADRKETLEEGVYCWVDEARLLLMDVFRRRQAFTYETKQLERFWLKGGEKKAIAEEVCRLSVCLSYWLLWNWYFLSFALLVIFSSWYMLLKVLFYIEVTRCCQYFYVFSPSLAASPGGRLWRNGDAGENSKIHRQGIDGHAKGWKWAGGAIGNPGLCLAKQDTFSGR